MCRCSSDSVVQVQQDADWWFGRSNTIGRTAVGHLDGARGAMDERSLSAQHVPPVPHHELAKPKSLASLGGHETRVGVGLGS